MPLPPHGVGVVGPMQVAEVAVKHEIGIEVSYVEIYNETLVSVRVIVRIYTYV
jgi:hypothetical protein